MENKNILSNTPEIYASAEFEAAYTYTGNDLGACWTPQRTTFRVWAPTAGALQVQLFRSGDPQAQDLLETLEMTRDVNGTWVAGKSGDLNGVYYTYRALLGEEWVCACDPYARTTGVNGQRAMVLDLASTDPHGWNRDKDPHFGKPITDAVIYELHLRDISCGAGSGIKNRGKFLGLTESGTVNSTGIPTGLDHLKNLGITHVHLLPVYDFGSVDETDPQSDQYNWGYDPVNFNAPEGSYSTDPHHGEVRVAEMKQMVKALHDNGISVIMDVVYNHVYDAGSFCFNRLVPFYFSRTDGQGNYSNGSGCGNDTASERSMVRKFIVDSVKYWADEYHIDGFRFDLVGLIDTDTIRSVMDTVRKDHPNMIFYGEGWTMDTKLTKENVTLTTQRNSQLVPGFAFFSDTLRDLLKGTVFDAKAKGYVSGMEGLEEELNRCFLGMPAWCGDPAQSINYASCHDNLALFDRIVLSTPEATPEQRIRMNRLCAAIYMTCQGVPFLQAGEEFLRSKPLPDGGFEENSYRSPDSVNAIRWENLNDPVYRETAEYYRGLIAFRKAHPCLRMHDTRDVRSYVLPIEGLAPNVTAFQILPDISGRSSDGIFAVFNPNPQEIALALPAGNWELCVNGEQAGVRSLQTVSGQITVPGISPMVLVQRSAEKPRKHLIAAGAIAAAAAVGGIAALLLRRRRK